MLGSALTFAAAFVLLLEFGTPGRGIGQALYIPVVLAALASDTVAGAAAGAVALVVYEAAELIAGRETWAGLLTTSTTIRLATLVAAGAIVGWFATRARRKLADSLHVLDELLVLARRDLATGLPGTDSFERALDTQLAGGRPCALLLVDRPGPRRPRLLARAEEESRELARAVTAALEPEARVAVLGPRRLAALTSVPTRAAARETADTVERALVAGGTTVTVGWAFHPSDGDSGLALFAAAVERLQTRRLVRGEWRPTPETAGLVAELRPR